MDPEGIPSNQTDRLDFEDLDLDEVADSAFGQGGIVVSATGQGDEETAVGEDDDGDSFHESLETAVCGDCSVEIFMSTKVPKCFLCDCKASASSPLKFKKTDSYGGKSHGTVTTERESQPIRG